MFCGIDSVLQNIPHIHYEPKCNSKHHQKKAAESWHRPPFCQRHFNFNFNFFCFFGHNLSKAFWQQVGPISPPFWFGKTYSWQALSSHSCWLLCFVIKASYQPWQNNFAWPPSSLAPSANGEARLWNINCSKLPTQALHWMLVVCFMPILWWCTLSSVLACGVVKKRKEKKGMLVII